jgi:hypothetical protein
VFCLLDYTATFGLTRAAIVRAFDEYIGGSRGPCRTRETSGRRSGPSGVKGFSAGMGSRGSPRTGGRWCSGERLVRFGERRCFDEPTQEVWPAARANWLTKPAAFGDADVVGGGKLRTWMRASLVT